MKANRIYRVLIKNAASGVSTNWVDITTSASRKQVFKRVWDAIEQDSRIQCVAALTGEPLLLVGSSIAGIVRLPKEKVSE